MTLFASGKVGAAIVLPDHPTKVATFAAKELVYHVKQSTGAELPVVSECATPSNALLSGAKSAAVGDAVAQQRVSFLEKSLKNAELVLAAQQAYLVYAKNGDLAGYTKAIRLSTRIARLSTPILADRRL